MPSLITSFAVLAFVAQVSAHLSLVSIHGSNGAVGHGFGVNLDGKYPRERGVPGDAGGDSTVFQTGTDNPTPACGRTPELGPIDIPAWLSQAEGTGLPAAHTNLSVVATAFQVNRDGGGPMSCEYNEDATATSWKPMFMSLNQAGNSGIQNQVRNNETVVMNFPEGAKCVGGWTQSACIVRCRTGVNKRFGGCFAVKLSDSAPAALTAFVAVDSSADVGAQPLATASASNADDSESASHLATSTLQLSDEQIDSIVQQVITQMKKEGLVLAASTSQTDGQSSVDNLNATDLSQISQAIQLDSNNTGSVVTKPAANASQLDTSDAEDTQLYKNSTSSVEAVAASNIVDNQVYNLTSPADNLTSPADNLISPADSLTSRATNAKPKHHKCGKHSRKCSSHKKKH